MIVCAWRTHLRRYNPITWQRFVKTSFKYMRKHPFTRRPVANTAPRSRGRHGLCGASDGQEAYWAFADDNVRALSGALSRDDARVFDFDVRNIDWDAYIESYVLGIRRFLFKESPESLPRSRALLWRLRCTQHGLGRVHRVVRARHLQVPVQREPRLAAALEGPLEVSSSPSFTLLSLRLRCSQHRLGRVHRVVRARHPQVPVQREPRLAAALEGPPLEVSSSPSFTLLSLRLRCSQHRLGRVHRVVRARHPQVPVQREPRLAAALEGPPLEVSSSPPFTLLSLRLRCSQHRLGRVHRVVRARHPQVPVQREPRLAAALEGPPLEVSSSPPFTMLSLRLRCTQHRLGRVHRVVRARHPQVPVQREPRLAAALEGPPLEVSSSPSFTLLSLRLRCTQHRLGRVHRVVRARHPQ
ncbi:hypothetical protein OBRU01_22080, partial [Operophtera brumata]